MGVSLPVGHWHYGKVVQRSSDSFMTACHLVPNPGDIGFGADVKAAPLALPWVEERRPSSDFPMPRQSPQNHLVSLKRIRGLVAKLGDVPMTGDSG